MKKTNFLFMISIFGLMFSCQTKQEPKNEQQTHTQDSTFEYVAEQFADLRVLRYKVHGFENLAPKQKELLYYLYQAAYSGRDMIYDQNYKYNLTIRRTLEAIIVNYQGDKNSDEYKNFLIYAKRIWFSNGIHHHYSADKFIPECSKEYFTSLLKSVPADKLPLRKDEKIESFVERIIPVIFDPQIDAKRICLDTKKDVITNSANNLYEGVTQKEVEEFYKNISDSKNQTPPMYGLNSKLVKENGQIKEKTYKVGGMYDAAISKIVYWLEKAVTVAESDLQKQSLEKLIEFYKTGDLKIFDEYSILWVKDTEPMVDVVNGFIEVYGDALGYRGAWQSVFSIKDLEMTKKLSKISSEAAWFEKNSPIQDEYKRENPQGVSYKVIQVIGESGDCSPTTPIGVNLPNSNWLRATYGSKSVSLANIEESYSESEKNSGLLQEFHTPEQIEHIKKYGDYADKLHTGLHEVIGHGSGKIKADVGSPNETLKSYANTLEEARADLVALYFLYDQHLVDVGLIPTIDAGKASYDYYIVNGLMRQLRRIKVGDVLEESHMRNRQLIAKWCFEKGKAKNVIEKKKIDSKIYFVINDYSELKKLFGELLREIQRIKSEGDFQAGKKLVETYAVKIDQEVHKEVVERFQKLNASSYSGFINPKLTAVEKDGKIVDVKIEYPKDFTEQMLYYATHFSFLPNEN